jgi:hypothetical protein
MTPIVAIGALVESMMYENFSLLTFAISVAGLIPLPTITELE